MRFEIVGRQGTARAGLLHLPHGTLATPAFMPVGTLATVKSMTPGELQELGYRMLLNNAFHLYLRPGVEVVEAAGGLHRFQDWEFPLLTDSGGFQVFSLSKLRKVTEEGVRFQSPVDGSSHFFTPESVMQLQERLGPDIAMVLDDVLGNPAPHQKMAAAMERTLRWARRASGARTRDDQAVFGIVQGGLHPDLRAASLQGTVEIGFDGYAIGGLSVGDQPEEMYPVVRQCAASLPQDCPRYLMGVGTPADLRHAVAAGVDLFDCVLPTRLARHHVGITAEGKLNLFKARFKMDFAPLEAGCDCLACRRYSRAYLHHLCRCNEILAARLLTTHNLRHYARLMQELRNSILDQSDRSDQSDQSDPSTCDRCVTS